MSPVKTEYVGSMPQENGNYLVFDSMTRNQWVVKLFQDSEGQLKVLCGHDHTVHSAETYNHPNIRWVRIVPLTHDEIDRYVISP